jgi:hypothetical protein
MNTVTSSSEAIRGVFTQPARDMVGIVDDLLMVCREHDLELDWRPGCCRVRSHAADWREVPDLPLRKTAFRGILARLSALCNERHPSSCTPYGGQGEIAVGTTVFRLVFTNTPGEQRLRLAVNRPAMAPIAGNLTTISPMTDAMMNEPLTFEAAGHPMLAALTAKASQLRDPLLWAWTESWLLPALDAFQENATEGEVADALNHLAQELSRRADVDHWLGEIAELRSVEYAGPPHAVTSASKLERTIELPANRTKNRFTIEQARQLREALRPHLQTEKPIAPHKPAPDDDRS